jgi:hypothetical protein
MHDYIQCEYCLGACRVGYGKCHCGCGRETTIPTVNSTVNRRTAGRPIQFIHGHNRVKPKINGDTLGRFRINGIYCRLVPLTRGQYAIVWEVDYDRIAAHHWTARWCRGGRTHYAVRGGNVRMHREILLGNSANSFDVDHIAAGDGLDNRRDNLRLVTHAQNSMNRRASRFSRSGLKGVSWDAASERYLATIRVNGKRKHLGSSTDPVEAHNLYCRAAEEAFGKFARFQ